MPDLESVARAIWKGVTYIFLIAAMSIAGAHFGSMVDFAIVTITGEPPSALHGRCAGWTIFFLAAVIGAPLGYVYWGAKWEGRRRCRAGGAADAPAPTLPEAPAADSTGNDPPLEPPIGGLEAFLAGPLIGGFIGLVLGGIVGGFLIMLYFFAATSPLAPGGWWPILPLTARVRGGGFSSKDPLIMIPWLIVAGTFVAIGAVAGLFAEMSFGRKRFQALGRRREETGAGAGSSP